MKIIFLDFDGVLNSEKFIKNCGHYGVVINPEKMILLKQIVDATSAEIVLSTSWREHWSKNEKECKNTGLFINEIFSQYNLQIFDKTPQLTSDREQEIKKWLDDHTSIKNFVVLDDMLLCADYLKGHFVKTSNHFDGLNKSDVEKAINILNT